MYRITVTVPPARLLPLDYAPEVPPELLHEMECLGKRMGLALDDLELLGQDAGAIETFLQANSAQGPAAAIDAVAWEELEALWAKRRRQAAR